MRLTVAGHGPGGDGAILALPQRTVVLGAYTATTIVAGFAVLIITAILALRPGTPVIRQSIEIPGLDPSIAGAAGVGVWIAFALAGSARILRDPGGHAALTFHLPFIAAALVLGGPVAGIWVAALGTFERRELREVPWYGVLANHAGLALAALVGGIVMEVVLTLAGTTGLGAGPVAWLVALIAGTAVLAITSAGFAAGVVVLRDGLGPRDAVALLDGAFRRTAVAETLLGWLFVIVWVAAGWWAPALLTIVVLTLWHAAADADQLGHDELTGVLSRSAFAIRVAQAAERARRGVDGAAYLFLDLDGFKAVNDGARSHLIGDQVLVTLGERLRRAVRVTDAVGRRGGDEFMVLFTGVRDEATALRLAERINDVVTAPYATDDGEKRVGVSIGLALLEPGRRDFEPDVRQHADAAMYEAKARGGGICTWREPSPD